MALASRHPEILFFPSRHLRWVTSSSLRILLQGTLLQPSTSAVRPSRGACAATREETWRRDQDPRSQGAGRASPGSQSARERCPLGRARQARGGVSWVPGPQQVQLFQDEVADGSERRWPRQSRSQRMMNGAAGPSHMDRRERVLKLGESFEKQPRCAFHTIRCE